MKHSAKAVSLSAASAAIAASLLLAGCGSGGSHNATLPGAAGLSAAASAASRVKGEVSFTVKWPAPTTRLIPSASNSIKITLTRLDATGAPSSTSVSQILARPAPGTPLTVTATFSGLLPGNYIALAQAFPNNNATGTAQASGSGPNGTVPSGAIPIFVKGGLNPPLVITMGSTITALTVNPQNGPFLRAGDTRVFTVTATDATGAIVLVNKSILFELSTPGPFKLVQNGPTATLTYTGGPLTSNISAQVKASDLESGFTSTATATFVVAGPIDPTLTWGKFHANAQNTGQAAATPGFVNATGVGVSGFPIATLAQIEFSSPAIALDGTVYVGANDGNLYAFTPGGAIKWKFATGGFIESSPAIGRDGTVYFGSIDGNIYAVRDNGSSASVVWQTAADGPVFGSPTIDSNGYLYIASTTPGHTLYKLDSLGGAIVWQFSTPADGMQGAPALSVASLSQGITSEQFVYIGSLDNNVYAVRTSDGAQQWFYPTGQPIFSSSPAVALVGGSTGIETVFIGSLDGQMYAINALTGGTVWKYDTQTPIYSSPAVAANPAQGGALTVYFATFDNTGGNGNQVFGISAAGTPGGQPQSVFFAQTFPQGFTSSPAVSPDGTQLYIGSYDGNVYGLNTDNGSTSFVFATPPAPINSLPEQFDSSPALAPDGTIYIGGFSGNLYAIK